MQILGPQATYVMRHPGAFALGVVRAFRTNQGLLLAGAVAYFTSSEAAYVTGQILSVSGGLTMAG